MLWMKLQVYGELTSVHKKRCTFTPARTRKLRSIGVCVYVYASGRSFSERCVSDRVLCVAAQQNLADYKRRSVAKIVCIHVFRNKLDFYCSRTSYLQ